jgi:hypothetical protein
VGLTTDLLPRVEVQPVELAQFARGRGVAAAHPRHQRVNSVT